MYKNNILFVSQLSLYPFPFISYNDILNYIKFLEGTLNFSLSTLYLVDYFNNANLRHINKGDITYSPKI